MSQDFTQEEADSLVSAFKALGARPKTDRPEDLVEWMENFVHARSSPKESVTLSSSTSGLDTEATPRQILSHQLRLPIFYGDGKGDASFDLWRYEVTCLMKETYSSDTIMQTIRRSLRGEAGRIAMRLGPSATINELLSKMNSIYGEVEQTEVLLANFYSARQKETEDVSDWGCRLEDLLSKASELDSKDPEDRNQMLRVMFWSGLRPYLKDITAHLYERIDDFDRLRVAVRRIETDHKHRQSEQSSSTVKTACKPAIAEEHGILEELKGAIHQLSTDMKALKTDQEQLASQVYQQIRQPVQIDSRPSQSRENLTSRQDERLSQNSSSGQQHRRTPYREPSHSYDASRGRDSDIICWKCGQPGHIALGCRVRLDHRRRLNGNRPMPRDRH